MIYQPIRQQLSQSLSLSEFENWRPNVDVPELHRPVARPEEIPGDGRIASVLINRARVF